MGGIVDLFELLGAVAVLIAVVAFFAAPELLAGLVSERRDRFEARLRQQAELDRKTAIAEAAIAARARGETFVPPADYDR